MRASTPHEPAHAVSRRLPLLLLLLVAAISARAGEPLILEGSERTVDLRPHLLLLRDAGARLAPGEAMARGDDYRPAVAARDLNLGYTRDALWLRIDVRSALSRASDWRLELDYPSLDRVDLFERLPDGRLSQLSSGDTLAFGERALAHRHPVFPVHLDAGERRVLFLRAFSEGSLTVRPSLWEASAHQSHSEAGYAAYAAYFGMLLALALYNLMLFFALRDRAYLLYVGFVASFGVGVASLSGMGAQFVWPEATAWNNRALPIGIALSSVLAPLFTRVFLDTARRAPFWHRLLGASALLQAGVLLVAIFGSVQAGVQAMSAGGVVNCLLMLACGIACALRGLPGARLFVLAWAVILLGGTMLALRNFGLMPTHFVTLYAMQIGSALEMLLLSFALAARFNELKREKERAQADALASQARVVLTLQQQERVLEERVTERTEALAAANAQLRELAMRDPLTALANRAALYAHLDAALQRAQRKRQPLALLMIDLDGFKTVNDSLGHEAGDQVLVEVAERLNRCARGGDLVARLGGDEFVLVCEDVGAQAGAQQLAERLLVALGEPIETAGRQARVGASIGIALARPGAEESGELLRRADRAMYAAKAAGRGAIHLAEMPAGRAGNVAAEQSVTAELNSTLHR